MQKKGFTLIELLIVVAIIAILAAIAVPNFLEAQTRSKVSRAKADMRTLSMGVESYTIDNNRRPIGWEEGVGLGVWKTGEPYQTPWTRLTTPMAYLTSLPDDPFALFTSDVKPANNADNFGKKYFYSTFYKAPSTTIKGYREDLMALNFFWYMRTPGPATKTPITSTGGTIYPTSYLPGSTTLSYLPNSTDIFYDPSNGTTSIGWMVRTNKGFYPESK